MLDHGDRGKTGVILSRRAYARLARVPTWVLRLFPYGVVDVEYRTLKVQHNFLHAKNVEDMLLSKVGDKVIRGEEEN